MPKLFGIDIAKIANDAVASAGGVLDAKLLIVTPGTRTAGALTAGKEEKARPISCKGFVGSYRESQIDGERIQQGDRRIVLMGQSISNGKVAPKPNDQIIIENQTFTIVGDGVARDPAAATYVCQCRA